MPLFGSRREPSPPPEPVPERRSGGLFSSRRNRSVSPVSSSHSSSYRTSSSSTRHSTSTDNHSTHRQGSILHKFGRRDGELDPSISAARDRVINAERAEKEADRALDEARRQVRDAREHVKALEHEAAEEARRAKVKQYHAKEMTKRGKHLGRHDL